MNSQLRDHLNEYYKVDFHHNLYPPRDELLRLSPAIEEYIQSISNTTKEELLSLPILSPPRWDDSHPLTHYFVSSSHNTYLLSRQLVGRASAESYIHALSRGAHCVEIDVWPSSDSEGLVVTHGYTLTTGVPFRKVCEAVGSGVDALGPNAWPVLVSLECHVGPKGQQNMVNILKSVWGEKLVVGRLQNVDGETLQDDVMVSPKDLKGRIILMVEYYPPDDFVQLEAEEEIEEEIEEVDPAVILQSTASENIVEGEDLPQVLIGEVERGKISDELAALGYYARSWKPPKGWLLQELIEPRHILINISESKILSLLPTQLDSLIEHGRLHLRRIFPKGTRIRSSNMDVLKFWRNGSHVVSLNWQTFDTPLQINEAMFVGSPGWVLKPKTQRLLNPESSTLRLSAEVVGISSLLPPSSHHDKTYNIYVEAELLHNLQDLIWKSKTRTTTQEGDVMWNETLAWEFERDELAFIRLLVRENRRFGKDLDLAVFCARVDDLQRGWRLAHMFNVNGRAFGATLLVKFEVTTRE